MKKTIKYVLLITLIVGFCLTVGGVLFSVGHDKVQRVDIKTYPKELIELEKYVKKEFNLDTEESIYDLRERGCSELYGKNETFYKENFNIYLNEIKTHKYMNDTISLDKKIDSIAVIINKYIPHKECHDSISIYYYFYDPINKKHYHDVTKMYKVN
jgi:hypothetical protein